MQRNHQAVIALALAAVLFIGGFAAWSIVQRIEEARIERILLERKRTAWQQLRGALWNEIRRFDGQAGVLIEDLQTGWKMGYQSNEKFPAASLVKIPVMTAYYQAADEGVIQLSDKIMLKGSDKVGGSGRLQEAPAGSAYTIEELIQRMVTESDNTASNMLINYLGFDYLNNAFQKQRLGGTTLVRRMMDFSQRKNGVENYTTAEDVALLLRQLYYFRMSSAKTSQRCLELLMQQKLNDRIPAMLPPEILVAHKTGLENGVCHDSGIVFTGDGNYLITVLTKHNEKTSKRAKKFIARLSSLTYHYMTES